MLDKFRQIHGYLFPVCRGGTLFRYSQIAVSSESVIFANDFHGMNSFSTRPSGRFPSRKAVTKSFSLQLPRPVGVRFDAGGRFGGPATRPPDNPFRDTRDIR